MTAQVEMLVGADSFLRDLEDCQDKLGMIRMIGAIVIDFKTWSLDEFGKVGTSTPLEQIRYDFCVMMSIQKSMAVHCEGQLRRVPDLERIAARLHRTHAQPEHPVPSSGSRIGQIVSTWSKAQGATLEDLVNLYHCILATDKMIQALQAYQGKHREVLEETLLERLRSIMKDFGNFRALVEQTIDLQQAELRNYCISTAFDPSLKQLAMQRDKVREQMEAVRADVDKKLNLAGRGNEKSVSLNECPEGLALRVTKKHQQAVQKWNGKPPLKVLSLKKTEVFFTTTELVKLNKDLQQAVDDYQKQTDALVAKALKVASTYSSVVERLADVLADLDVLCSLARVALTAPCTFVRAKLDESGKDCVVDGAVHVLVTANSTQSFVANSVEMHRDSSRLHLITGPNMGGKSTYIRSIALIALLNQMGSFVPCRSAVLPCFDSIMCRVGASDMQLRGISTFMAEMLEAACILNVATERSLVIVDELGRGTSTADGFGIAWAIAKHLVEDTRCFTLFATHFHELAALEQATAAVRNRHATAVVEPQSGRLTFLYALADGAADQSYGAFVAELAGFPERVVAEARRQAEELESASSFGRARKRRRRDMLPESVQNIFEAENEEPAVCNDVWVNGCHSFQWTHFSKRFREACNRESAKVAELLRRRLRCLRSPVSDIFGLRIWLLAIW
eukprot:s5666_g1.t1